MIEKGYQIGDYAETYRNYNPVIPKRFNWAYEVFDKWGSNKNKVAMLWVGQDEEVREITFRQFTTRSKRVANALTGLGAQPGDRIFTMLPRVVAWWEIVLGCMRAKLLPVPGTTLLTSKDIIYRLNASQATIAITDKEGFDKLQAAGDESPYLKHIIVVGETGSVNQYEELLMAASPNLPHPNNLSSDPMIIYFTSGTTGNPKMVVNTHASYPIGLFACGKYWLDNRPSDIHWTLADTGWAQAAWTCFFAPWNMGAAIFIADHRGRFDPALTLRMFEKHPVTTFFGPTTAYRLLVQEDFTNFNPIRLRHTVAAGEAVNPEVITSWKELTGHHIYEGYGQTENTLLAATFPGIEYKPGSMGVVAPGYNLGVVDNDGMELPAGEEGEIAIRTVPQKPVGLMSGYMDNLEANENCFKNGWYYTGDLATRDVDGYFWFVGRGDDLINSSAYRIGPFEVESALIGHPAVAEAAVVGIPDSVRGSIVKAFVVLAHEFTPTETLISDLQEHVKVTTAPYKYPRQIEFVPDLPKTISGKIRRVELRNKSE